MLINRIASQAGDLALFASVSLAFGIAKAILVPSTDNWKHQLSSLFISMLVGTMAGALAMQSSWGDYTVLMAASAASLLSRDIILAVLNNRQILGDLLKQAAVNLVDKWTK